MDELNITPIFIMGAYRSGTTMLASHLASSEHAIALPEMPFVLDIIESNAKTDEELSSLYNQLTQQFHYQASGMSITFDEFAQPFKSNAPRAERVFHILRLHFGLSQGDKRFWIEHTPHNRERVEKYLAVFPNAKFIHIVRDPRAVYASMHNLIRWNSQDPVAFAKKWQRAITYSHLACCSQPDITFELNYEEYVTEQATILPKLCRFIGIPYTREMNAGNGIKLPQYTLKQHQLVGQAPDATRIHAWQQSIDKREAEIIQSECQPWMKHYGMTLLLADPKPITLKETLRYKLKQRLYTPLSKLKRLKDKLITSHTPQ
ncbi:sulfotransferase [Thalassotalea sp. LPB0316]|uniref:sulfotransferase family protein n=1 Tax=Thalassotalea sp. LPB0316 TaxID=2769490 RepID=UPI0018695D46|nr:sulfotransferase [Thalassotalea sp. LPB0316]QOL26456.1 sulfotransferase [Thalassotalea sp. LPB0316]